MFTSASIVLHREPSDPPRAHHATDCRTERDVSMLAMVQYRIRHLSLLSRFDKEDPD